MSALKKIDNSVTYPIEHSKRKFYKRRLGLTNQQIILKT